MRRLVPQTTLAGVHWSTTMSSPLQPRPQPQVPSYAEMQQVPRPHAFTPSLREVSARHEHWLPAVVQTTLVQRHVDAGAGQSFDAQQSPSVSVFCEQVTEFGRRGAPSVVAGIVQSHEGAE